MTLPTYTSTLSIPYSPHSPLNTLDLHTRTTNSTTPPTKTYNLIYIHGGAFRDPLITSRSLLPSLSLLFQNPHIDTIASLNYRLSPYPSHPSHPSYSDEEEREKEGRNAKWPVHINDVRDAVRWLMEREGWRGREWMCVGHSVGGTMGMLLALQPPPDGRWGEDVQLPGLKAVVALEGIYDFVALRDAHLEYRDVYDAFISAAFGAEESGGWERGNVVGAVREWTGLREGLQVVVVGQSRRDEAVEWGQGVEIVKALEEVKERGVRMELVELEGGHDEIVSEGKAVGEVVGRAVEMLVEWGEGGE